MELGSQNEDMKKFPIYVKVKISIRTFHPGSSPIPKLAATLAKLMLACWLPSILQQKL